jgi:transcriptional regulator with XRE-family HTH domain
MLITVEQVKAARALLGWSQKDLAQYAGLTQDHIANYETQRSRSLDVLEAINRALNTEGIVFTQKGVELNREAIKTFDGEGWYLRLLDDVYETLKDTKDAELLLFCADDKVSPPEVNSRYRKLRKAGVRMRQLVEEGNTYLMGNLTEYRYVPKENFTNYVCLVYGKKVAVCADQNTKAVVFNDLNLATMWTSVFNIMWASLKQPQKSDADERF